MLSSPTIHQAFLTERERLLSCILQKQYGELLPEAIAFIRSRGLFFAKYKEEAIALLDTWRRRQEIKELALSSSRLVKPTNMEEIMGLLQFGKVLQFFLKDYTVKLPRPGWIEADQWEKMLPIELSNDEKHRFLRALCRLQIYSNIFAIAERRRNDKDYFDNDWQHLTTLPSAEEEVYRLFYGTLPPWEYVEMGCVWTYLQTKFGPVYKVVADGLRDLVEKHGNASPELREYFEHLDLPYDQRPWWGGEIESVFQLDDLPDCSNSLAAFGPSFVYRLLHAEPLLQREMVLCNASFWRETFIGCAMFVGEDEMLPLIYPADRHAVKDFDQFWTTLPPLERPNLAWKNVYLWAHNPGDNFEEAVDIHPDQTGWDWGIAIWDDERLKSWETPDLQRQERIPARHNPQ